jgi:hypothetical protein
MASIMRRVVSHFACGEQRSTLLKSQADRILARNSLTITADGEGTGGSVLPPHSNFDHNCLANLTLGRTYLFSFSRYH